MMVIYLLLLVFLIVWLATFHIALYMIRKDIERYPVLRYNELTGQMFVERPLPDATEETSAEIFEEPTKEEAEQYQREQNPLYSAVKKLLK